MPIYPPGMEYNSSVPDSAMVGGQFNAQSLADIARPSFEEEDIGILNKIRELAAMVKQLMIEVKSGDVDDVLTAIYQKLNMLQKKYDQLAKENEGA